ncbi:hypothetical protein cypCar_00020919 [Cyprinus carpio]|nr:hypothetical protein cypCar_00020919 [Cyprinus carpio]
MSEKKMTSSRRHHLKSLILGIAKDLLVAEEKQVVEDRVRYMEEKCPPLSLPSSLQELQNLCKELHQKIDVADEERYDLSVKVTKGEKEIEDLKIKVQDLIGKFKKPALKKVRMSADAMLQALLGSKHKVSLDLRANLKQVKKEVKEEVSAHYSNKETHTCQSNYLKTWSSFTNYFRIRRQWETGVRTLRISPAWAAGRRCLNPRLKQADILLVVLISDGLSVVAVAKLAVKMCFHIQQTNIN